MTHKLPPLPPDLTDNVAHALQEDIGRGDLSAALVAADAVAEACVISREDAVLCGTAWFNEVFRHLDPLIQVSWEFYDGERLAPNQEICRLRGSARALLSGERTALNFLQVLSATATAAQRYADAVAGTGTAILDTRKTLPGLRAAQKYATTCGGCRNHRRGLDDGILLKENHIVACGSIAKAIAAARASAPLLTRVEVEVENLEEVDEALQAGADTLLLDNFSLNDLRQAVVLCNGRAVTEASGGVSLEQAHAIAATGVDFVSVGAITKDVRAVDLSMRFLTSSPTVE